MIYYTSASGQIIGGTAGSDLTGITHLPSGADYAVYVDDSTVTSLNPNNVPGTYSFTNVVAADVYIVPTATGTLTFTEQSATDQLAAAKSAKKTQLYQQFGAALLQGFQSDPLGTGTPSTFGFAPADQQHWDWLRGMVTAGTCPNPIQVKDINGNRMSLTPTQAGQLCTDGQNFYLNNYTHWDTKEQDADAATTVDAVNAITW